MPLLVTEGKAMVEIIWKEPPPAVSSEKAPILAELQKHPGRWALVQSRYKSSSAAAPWRKLGCEATHRRSESGKTGEYDVYARWPEQKAEEAAEEKPVPASAGKAAVEKAISSGTALKPAPAAARPPLPAPKASGGYSQFLANQRAGTVAAAAE
jgi:hypothetical protein